jgi:hypothetical protein
MRGNRLLRILGAVSVAAMLSTIPAYSSQEEGDSGTEPGGEACGDSWDFKKAINQKSHSSAHSRTGWDVVTENYDIAHAHEEWVTGYTSGQSSHTSCN